MLHLCAGKAEQDVNVPDRSILALFLSFTHQSQAERDFMTSWVGVESRAVIIAAIFNVCCASQSHRGCQEADTARPRTLQVRQQSVGAESWLLSLLAFLSTLE